MLLNAFNPHVAVDAHEYSANRLYGDGGWGVGSDGLFAAAKVRATLLLDRSWSSNPC